MTITSTAEQLAEYKAQIDKKYQVRETYAEAIARVDAAAQGTPVWLLVDPNGVIDGWHSYRAKGWDSIDNVWRRFEPRKRDRDALQRSGWTVRRDDKAGTGLAAFRASKAAGEP